MVTVKTKQDLGQAIKNYVGNGIFRMNNNPISVVINSVPIGYIACVLLGIGSWKQSFVYLLALCVSYLIGMVVSVKTFNKMARYSLAFSFIFPIVVYCSKNWPLHGSPGRSLAK